MQPADTMPEAHRRPRRHAAAPSSPPLPIHTGAALLTRCISRAGPARSALPCGLAVLLRLEIFTYG